MLKINEIPVEFIIYPSGEFGITNYDKIFDFALNTQRFACEWETGKNWEREYITLNCIAKAMYCVPRRHFSLIIDFLPLSREDKTENGRLNFIPGLLEPLNNWFTAIKFETIHSTDEQNLGWHSYHSWASHYPYYDPLGQDNWLTELLLRNSEDQKNKETLFIFPDQSAQKRYQPVLEALFGDEFKSLTAAKKRNKENGEIIQQLCFDETTLKHSLTGIQRIVMIDDLMAYGGSFKRIYNEINNVKPGLSYDLYLYGKEIHEGVNIDPIKIHWIKNLEF